jgi:hypothetical protein
MAEGEHLVARERHVAEERHPVRELAAVLDRDEPHVELELRTARPHRRRLGRKRPPFEHVLQERVGDGLLPLDDA